MQLDTNCSCVSGRCRLHLYHVQHTVVNATRLKSRFVYTGVKHSSLPPSYLFRIIPQKLRLALAYIDSGTIM